MSEAAICDYCRRTFALGEKGSQRFVGTASETDSRGRVTSVNKVMDQCGVCAAGNVTRPAIDREAFVEEMDQR